MKNKVELRTHEKEIWDDDRMENDPIKRGELDVIGWLLGESDPITDEEIEIPTSDKELDKVIATLKTEKGNIREYSFFGDPNWKIFDAQIEICKWAKSGGK